MITKKQVLAWMDKNTNSRRVNPKEKSNCVYTSRTGAHCIAGQFLVDQGMPLPPRSSKLNSAYIPQVIAELQIPATPQAVQLLARLQRKADDLRHTGVGSWRDAIAAIKNVKEYTL